MTNPMTVKIPNSEIAKIFIRKHYATIFSIAVILLVFSVVKGLVGYSEIKTAEVARQEATTLRLDATNPFRVVNLEAESAYVLDLKTGQTIFSKNATAQLPLASLTKTMSAVVALEAVPEFTGILISDSAIGEEGDSGLKAGELWPLSKILGFSLAASSNDGVRAIAEALGGQAGDDDSGLLPNRERFVGMMNEKAKTLGLTQTFFLNETGLDLNEEIGGSYGSAEDMARLFDYILKNHRVIFEETAYPDFSVKIDGKVHTAVNTNKAIPEITSLIASKTGLTDLAGGNLVIAFDAGVMRPIVVSVLGSSEDGRFKDILTLVEATVEYLAQKDARNELN